ncbi:MAG: YbbR-like domain-containing protein [Candidatus Omnitrophica bacterium]|nr:YbbR-like domain-containing protein [Candidatus Omnitrophota bacterium]
MKLLKGSLVLKLVALGFAAATYFYIHDEITQVEKKALEMSKIADPSYKLIKLTAKSLPIKVRLATSPPEGYRIVTEKVAVNPPQIVVVGPEVLLEEASNAETALVDVSESTQNVTKNIPLESVAGTHLTGEPYVVEVTVPIEKAASDKP